MHEDEKMSSQQPTNYIGDNNIVNDVIELQIAILNTHKHELRKKLRFFKI